MKFIQVAKFVIFHQFIGSTEAFQMKILSLKLQIDLLEQASFLQIILGYQHFFILKSLIGFP